VKVTTRANMAQKAQAYASVAGSLLSSVNFGYGNDTYGHIRTDRTENNACFTTLLVRKAIITLFLWW